MATPHSNTDNQEDTESVDEPEDKPTVWKEKNSSGHKILSSKALRRVMGGRKLGSGGLNLSSSSVSVTSTSIKTMPAQSRQPAADRKDKELSKQHQQPLMATPFSNTDNQEDTESVDEPEDKQTAWKEKNSFKHKILHSKALRRVTGGRKLGSGGLNLSSSSVSVTSTSTNTMPAQSQQPAANRKDKQLSKQHQQPEPSAIPPAPGQQHNPPPQGPFFQSGSPITSPQVTTIIRCAKVSSYPKVK